MVKVNRCTFCGKDIPPGTGMMYIRTNGEIYHFCNSKCRKFKITYNKNPRLIRWTSFFGSK